MATIPKWQREIDIFTNIKTTFILEDNVFDTYPIITEYDVYFDELDRFIYESLQEKGYSNIIFFDPMNGFYNRHDCDVDIERILKDCGCEVSCLKKDYWDYLGNCYIPGDIVAASEIIKKAMTSEKSVVFVMSFVSRYCAKPDILEADERMIFMNLFYASLNSQMINIPDVGDRKNLLFMIVDKINDVPSWFFISNPFQKTITIPVPDKQTRTDYIEFRKEEFYGYNEANNEEQEKFCEELLHLTEGMNCIEINGLKNLCRKERINIKNISDAVSLYKYGIKENPWMTIPQEVLKDAEERIKKRVKGQDVAVARAVDIIKRAALGMSGLQHSSASSKPRGIMFFAGPTGTGKTELAKAIAELLFNDEDACIRFDMSEYQQAHSDQKLLGAPPGYVGYEAGGQLTNAIREKPFSILLFDEIEKADPSILDKFLQILEDGRMTDGQGNTVYFSESIVIFTSNLGIYKTNSAGQYLEDQNGNRIPNISVGDDYSTVQNNVISSIKNYMRPELLNRIGDNIIVFRFIDEEQAKNILTNKQIPSLQKALLDNKGIKLLFEESAVEMLMNKIKDNLSNGGRGIGNVMETYVINPLSRYLFDSKLGSGSVLTIKSFSDNHGLISLDCEVN